MTDEWTIPELARTLVDLRAEVREELKWLRRLLIGVLASAVLSSIVSSAFVVITK